MRIASAAGMLSAAVFAAAQTSAPDQEKTAPPAAPRTGAKIVDVGAADPKDAGALPPLTQELSQRAAAAVSKRDWKLARDLYRDLVEADPKNALALANLGSAEFQLKDYDGAIAHLEEAAHLRPRLHQTWLTLGMVHYQREDYLLALSAMSRGVAEKPDDPRGHNYLSAVLKALGWTTAAESELQKALDADPNFAEAHFNLAIMLLDRTPPSVELARRHYRRARELGSPPDEIVEKQLAEIAGDTASSRSSEDSPSPSTSGTAAAAGNGTESGSPGKPKPAQGAKPVNKASSSSTTKKKPK